MKAITFDGLGQYAFYDVRYDAEGRETGHVMDDPRFQAKGPRVAVVNKNFGCGSSREHAPQALLRWGVKALVGESFADIFFGNCVALGMPCATADEATVAALMAAVEEDPAHDLTVDVDGADGHLSRADVPGLDTGRRAKAAPRRHLGRHPRPARRRGRRQGHRQWASVRRRIPILRRLFVVGLLGLPLTGIPAHRLTGSPAHCHSLHRPATCSMRASVASAGRLESAARRLAL